MNATRFAIAAALAASLIPQTTFAEERDTLWVEPATVAKQNEVSLGFMFELHTTAPLTALEAADEWLHFRPAVGLSDSLELITMFGARQRGPDSLRIDYSGAQLRYRIPAVTSFDLAVFGSYSFFFRDDHESQLYQGVSAGNRIGPAFFAGELSLGEGFGSDLGQRVEIKASGAGGVRLLDGIVRPAFEAMFLAPLNGDRMTDPVFGDAGSMTSLYLGPTISVHGERVWGTLSLVNGILSAAGKTTMVRLMMSVRL